MIVHQVLVMDVHFIFFYEHHLLVQHVMKMQMAFEHLLVPVNSVDKKFEKYHIRMFLKIQFFSLLLNQMFKTRYCSHNLNEKVETRRCSILSIEIQIVIALFIVVASILISVVIMCWRRNRK
jgi:hypothetical protein